jgi:hypothetical protein
VLLIMGAYSGLVLAVTLHMQDALAFGPLHSGLVFSIYASGFALAGLTWTRAGTVLRTRLPVLGPLAMAAALLALGAATGGGGWPLGTVAPLLFVAGVGHACGFSPLAARLTTQVRPGQAADLSGLLLTASLIGTSLGVAAFTGVFLAAVPHGSGHAVEVTTAVIAAALLATAACARRAVAPVSSPVRPSGR